MNPPEPPPRIDPDALPLLGTGHGEPGVPPERLRLPGLRAHLADPPPWQAELHGDMPGQAPALADAAVLIALVQRQDAPLQVLLTRRTAHLRKHPGQISFPGGRAEPDDAGPAATALREAWEEIGLPPAGVGLLGSLPVYTTVTRYRVTPVLGLVQGEGLQLRPDPQEVGEVFEVPLDFLMDPRHHERRGIALPDGALRQTFSMPWTSPAGRRHVIWGATAAMLRNLYQLLRV